MLFQPITHLSLLQAKSMLINEKKQDSDKQKEGERMAKEMQDAERGEMSRGRAYGGRI